MARSHSQRPPPEASSTGQKPPWPWPRRGTQRAPGNAWKRVRVRRLSDHSHSRSSHGDARSRQAGAAALSLEDTLKSPVTGQSETHASLRNRAQRERQNSETEPAWRFRPRGNEDDDGDSPPCHPGPLPRRLGPRVSPTVPVAVRMLTFPGRPGPVAPPMGSWRPQGGAGGHRGDIW